MKAGKGISWQICGGLFLMLAGLPVNTAGATVYEFEVTGTAVAPVYHNWWGRLGHIGDFTLLFDDPRSDLRAFYDDGGTADSIDDDTFDIRGNVYGGVVDFEPARFDRAKTLLGENIFAFDVSMSNPTGGTGNPEEDGFLFDQQNAGQVTVVGGTPVRPLWDNIAFTADVMLKRDKTFALKVDAPSIGADGLLNYAGEGWIQLTGGFLGEGRLTRLEFGDGNAALNWNFNLVGRPGGNGCEGGDCEVPEPASLGLLSLGLLLGARKRRINKSE